MENETTSKPQPQRMVEYRPQVGGLPHVYANNVQLASTNNDVRIVFGEVAEVAVDKVLVEQRVQVAMTWIQAKILADFLRANVEAYETLNGPLTMPKGIGKIIVPETCPATK
jgi:Protein of unknown function (DUF3467)